MGVKNNNHRTHNEKKTERLKTRRGKNWRQIHDDKRLVLSMYSRVAQIIV